MKVKVTVTPIIIVKFGTIPKDMVKEQDEMEIGGAEQQLAIPVKIPLFIISVTSYLSTRVNQKNNGNFFKQ